METTTNIAPAPQATIRPRVPNKKNFRNSADVENFYRFVSENNLRREAKLIVQAIMKVANDSRKKSKRDAKKH